MHLIHWLLVASLVALATSTSDIDTAWQNFKATHGKQYKNLRQEILRKQIFTQNFEYISAHNKLFEDGLVSYSMKLNQYSDWTDSEIKNTLNGYKKSKIEVSDIDVIDFVPDENVEIPDEFDWREKGAVTPVKDQARCGSCWAFSAVGALEGQHFLKTGELVSISEQNLVDCSFEHNNQGCDGGDMNPAFTYVHNQDAIDSEEFYPYEGVDAKCRYDVAGNASTTRGYANIQRGNEEHLKAAVATIGPIAVGIDASQKTFDSYAEGIYYDPNCISGENDPEQELDHGVLVVGYGSEDGQDYWLIKNSWGTTWGDEGYIKVARNRENHCGVASEASFPLNY